MIPAYFRIAMSAAAAAAASTLGAATVHAQTPPPASPPPAVETSAAPATPTLRIDNEPTPCPLSIQCPAAPPPPESPFGYDGGLYLRTADRKYTLNINGFAQLLYVLNAPDGGSINQGFYLGLGRLAFSGNIFSPKFNYFFQFEGSTFGNNNGIAMLDWWLQYKVSRYFSITAGRFILPYSRQFYTHPGNLLFADLSPADYAFNMPRAIGVKLGGTVSRLSYDVFVVNSVRPLGVGTQVNRGDHIAAGARLELAILTPYGYMETMPNEPDKPQFSIGLAAAYNPIADRSSFQNVDAGDNTVNVTTDLGFRYRRLTVQGAFYYRKLLDSTVGDSYGFYGQAGVYLVKQRLELVARGSGALLADRSVVVGLSNPTSGSTLEYSGGFNAYLFGHGGKLQTDYTYVDNGLFAGGNLVTHRFRVQLQVLF